MCFRRTAIARRNVSAEVKVTARGQGEAYFDLALFLFNVAAQRLFAGVEEVLLIRSTFVQGEHERDVAVRNEAEHLKINALGDEWTAKRRALLFLVFDVDQAAVLGLFGQIELSLDLETRYFERDSHILVVRLLVDDCKRPRMPSCQPRSIEQLYHRALTCVGRAESGDVLLVLFAVASHICAKLAVESLFICRKLTI